MGVIFLNSHRAKSGIIDGKKLPDDYVLASRFFDCGIIDRTHSLEVGFDQQVLDKIPAFSNAKQPSFADICDQTAKSILAEAEATNRKIQLLWSGGIDSTVALAALLKNGEKETLLRRVEVLLSMQSINEYPHFFRQFILHQLPYRVIHPPITKHFAEDKLIVTGEHGDQLYG
ncbi:MAG: hypothetical protein AAFU03_16630, partial [Bacteroidota bacterium]